MAKPNEKEKAFTILEKNLNIISAVNNPKLGPYSDTFLHYPENVTLQGLGTLAGFFRIKDLSEESSYIVNFISSVLKKEYYANSKRPIENSFDSALRKINLALSEIAKEGNVNWIGKIDGAVCVLEKNNLHFSVCGKGKVLLIRNQILTEISRDMAQDEIEPNPLKTFVNVSSGRLEKGDRIIISGEDIFKVFTEDEIRKASTRFPQEKFSQFLKTALVNKLDIVGTIVIDVSEKVEIKKETEEYAPETYNAFSQKAYEKKKPAALAPSGALKEKSESEYTDEKTGHIYIQEEEPGAIKKESQFGLYWFLFKEKTADAYYWLKSRTGRKISHLGAAVAQMKEKTKLKMQSGWEKRKANKLEKERMKKLEEEIAKKEAEREAAISKRPSFIEILRKEKATEIKPETPKEFEKPEFKESVRIDKFARNDVTISGEQSVAGGEKISFLKKLSPSFGKIRSAFSFLSRKQKLYALAVIALIFIVPFIFLKVKDSIKKSAAPKEAAQTLPDAREILSQEKNIAFLDSLDKVFDIQDPKSLTFLNGKIIAANGSQLITQDSSGNTKEIPWDQNNGNIETASPMKDLNLDLFYTDQNKIISFFSATSQFAGNAITIPDNAKITGLGTYLTYAYLLDSQNNQIYRYPRATGGFGNKTNWLKDNLSLDSACCVAVDENVYLINAGKVIKLFKGQNQNLNLEETVNPFSPSAIFTDSDTQSLYILDKEFGRVIKYSKDGIIQKQYFNENIKNATGIAVDEANNKAYLITSEGLFSFNLQ